MARAIELAEIAIFINSRRFFLVASSELLSGSSVSTAPGEIIVHRIFWECSSIRSPSVGLVRCLSVTPDGRRAITGSYDQTLRVWNLETGECRRILKGHSGWVMNVSMTPDGRLAVSRGESLRVWDV